jgi:tetratricopeptide (TPR) repeat protein
MKKNAFILLIISSIFMNNIRADDLIFRDIQQKIDKKKINDVELTKVLETPSLFKNSTIRFNAKFTQTGNLSRVFHTKYDLSEYINLAVWPDEVKLWQKEGLKLFLPLVFVKKSSGNATVVGKLKKYQRIQITGLVTNDYQDQPWIEILDIKVLDKNALSEEALYHIRLGDKYHYGDNPAASKDDKSTVANIGVNLSHAEIEYNESLSFDLSDVEKSAVYELLGDVQIKQGKNEEAIISLTEALKINEESGRSNYLMALAQLNVGNFAQGKIYCEKSLAVSTKNKEVILCYAAILIKLEMYKLAEANCINANRLDADDIRPYALLGEIYNALNEYDVAKEMYRRAINLKDGVDNFSLHKNMAHQLLKIALVEKNAKERDNALLQADREFNATINQINDKDPESYYLWGRVLEEWKSRPKSETDAIEKFDKAIALDPNFFKAYMHKANVLNYRMNKPKEAIAGYEKASSIMPNELSPLKALDKIYREAKNYEKTVSVNERIVAIEPKNFGALYSLGFDNYSYLKQHAVAVDWFTKALAVDPNHAEAELYLGINLYLSGKKTEAIKHLIIANAKLPSEKSGNYYIAKAYVDTNQSGKAIEALVKYNGMNQENPETQVLLAREYANNQKTIALAIKTASIAVALAEKHKSFIAISYDIHGWSLALNKESQAALPLLEKANKSQNSIDIQYHLAYVYLQLNMFPETDSQLKALEASGLDKKQAADVKRLRSDLTDKMNKEMEAKKKASGASEKPVTTKPEKRVETKSVEKSKNEEDAKKAAKAAEKEAAENAKLEEKKRIAREKEKKLEQERLNKVDEEKARENAAAKKEEEAKLKKANENKAKEEKKKSEEDAKAKKIAEEQSKEKAEKDAEAKKIADKKAKEDAAKKAKEDAKAADAKEAQDKEAKAQQAKLAKEKEASDKKAKEDAAKKAKEDAKAADAKAAQDKEVKAQQAKLAKEAKEKEASDKKAKEEDAAKRAKEDAKMAESKLALEKETKALQAKLAKEKEASDKKAKEESDKKAKEAQKQAEKKGQRRSKEKRS